MDYLAVEKGWFSPYLFASGRRPIIPRSMTPDVIFCHGPFLSGNHFVMPLLRESASKIVFAAPAPQPVKAISVSPLEDSKPVRHRDLLSAPYAGLPAFSDLPKLSSIFARSRTPSPEPALAPVPIPPAPRRLVLVLVGLKPHRKLWTMSARPSESVMYYQLLDGCPAIVVPVQPGAPLLAWDTLTLEELWKVTLPGEQDTEAGAKFDGIVGVLLEFLELCVDWDRMRRPQFTTNGLEESENDAPPSHDEKREELRKAVALLVAGAVKSFESEQVKDRMDKERSGIAMWRIP